MATYQFSALSDGQSISFNPNADVLNFDQSVIAAADIRVTASGANTRIEVVSGAHAGKDILLLGFTPFNVTTTNITFADNSRIFFGDNTTGTTNDNAANTRFGTGFDDLLNGFGGADTLNGGGGDDVYFVSTGDVINEVSGVDTVHSDVSWTLGAGLENLTLIGTAAISGDGNALNNILIGNAGDNGLYAGDGADTAHGGAGNDVLYGFIDEGFFVQDDGAADHLDGGDGHDRLHGGGGNDTLIGGAGDDLLEAGWGANTLDGGLGNDTFQVYSTQDQAIDAGGIDTVIAVASDWTLASGFEHLTVVRSDFEVGSAGDRILAGNDLGNRIDATHARSAGIQGFGGNDTIFGAAGSQFGGGEEALNWIDGGDGNDSIEGASGSDELLGGAGNDYLNAFFHADLLDGGLGNDTLLGGGDRGVEGLPETDVFRFSVAAGAANADTVQQFNSAEDRILLDPDAMPALGARGDFAPGDARFHAAAGATGGHDADDRVVYNTATGQLFYDADGAGAGAAQLIATLGAGTNLVASDITVGDDLEPGRFISGTAGNDSLDGTSGNETIYGAEGNDTINGYGGNDYLLGAEGNDSLTGGSGADLFGFAEGASTAHFDVIVDFASGTDRIQLDGDAFAAIGASGGFSAGDERFKVSVGGVAQDSTDRVIYDPSSGHLFYDFDGSGTGVGRIFATLQGAPTISAADFTVINGESGAPMIITGNVGDDLLVGGSNDDTINGLGGNDSLYGVGGNDSLNGGDGEDLLNGGDGNDVLVGGEGRDFIYDGAGNDTLQGGNGDDEFHIGAGDDFVSAGAGDSLILVDLLDSGADTIEGGSGFDNLVLLQVHSAVSLDLRAGTLTGGGPSGAGSMAVTGVEQFRLTGHADQAIAGNSAVHLGGEAGNDTLTGGVADDTILGGEGDDVLTGGAGVDVLHSDHGSDTIRFVAAPGAANADIIQGFASDADKLRFDGSVFTQLGASGNFASDDERFHLGAAAHDASDRVIYDGGNLWYDPDGTGAQAAQLVATIFRMSDNGVPERVIATDIAVDNGTAPGGTINGTAGNDSLTGTSGNDTINGLAGSDTLRGLDGDDLLDGGDGVDTLDGGLGNDTYVVTAGDVLIADPGGIDTLLTGTTWNFSTSSIDNATVTGTAAVNIDGNALDNVIIGNDASNVINARAGSDTVTGNGGNDYFLMSMGGTTSFGVDWIDGGAGIDTVDYGANARSGMVVDLAAGSVSGGEAGGGGSATILNMEKFIAGGFADRVSGNATNNTVWGGVGNDTLLGLAGVDSLSGADGNDWVEGGTGFDTLSGGAGNDSFAFTASAGSANADRVTDFAAGADQLLFENGVFTALGAAGDWAAGDGRFRAAAGATSGADANDRLIYNTTNGNLYYDPDGVGGAAAQIVATLANLPVLSASDITVI